MKINSKEFEKIEDSLRIHFKKYCSIKILLNNLKPQLRYKNTNNHPYLSNVDENTKFCKFKTNLPNTSGVYIWCRDNEIIYIGEAVNLRDRFNTGYGNISPRNCFVGGQSTNVKMNRVVKETYDKGKTIEIYIYETDNHKEIESHLLKEIKTKYNSKNN